MNKLTSKLSTVLLVLLVALMLLSIVSCGRKGNATIQATPPLEKKKKEITVKKESKENINQNQQAQFPIPEEREIKNFGWVKKDLINVRSQPNTKSSIVATLKYGMEVQLLELKEKWWRVLLSNGEEAFIFQPLINEGKYVDPWIRFKMGCRLVDSSFSIISSIEQDSKKTGVNLIVNDDWDALTREEQRVISIKAFQYWKECLKDSLIPIKNAKIIIENSVGKKLVKIDTGTSQRGAQVTFLK